MSKGLEGKIQWLINEKYQGRLSKMAESDIERLKKGEPVDYLIGFSDFLGCKIDLSLKPFIPRPETEYWVGKVIKELKLKRKRLKILDIFSGSGCVGTAILKNIYFSEVDFAEAEKKFLKQIKVNLKMNKINPRRYRILKSDVFSGIFEKYDYILANPPYVAENKKNRIQKPVLKWEPRTSLFGGRDGLFFIKKFLKEAKNHLKPEGKIFMEFDPSQKREISRLLNLNGYQDYQFFKDQYKRWRYLRS